LPQLVVKDLTKEFKVLNRREGLSGAIKDLFSRNYKTVRAVDNINFSVEQGEIVGFIGANGAGKSTTIKMMTGLIKPTGGEVIISGYDPFRQRNEYLKNIGVVFGQRTQLWWEVPVVESFKLLKDIYEISDDAYNESIEMFDKLVNIKELYMTPARNLSLGQRMLCDITAAFLHNPKIIFLDEPTIGLDVNIKAKIRKMIRYLNQTKKTTVILTTHDTEDIEELAHRIILIDKGKILYDGEAGAFNHIFGAYKTIKIKVREEDFNDAFKIVALLQKDLKYYNDITVAEGDAGWINIVVNSNENEINELFGKVLKIYNCGDIVVSDVELASVLQRVYNGETDTCHRRQL
jgi:ABC-2 type transport system ATP-binding protein